MIQLQQIITTLIMILSINISAGILLHDTNIDKAILSSWKSSNPHYNIHQTDQIAGKHETPESHLHTHPEHMKLDSVLKDGQAHPRSTPRGNNRKHLQNKLFSRGGDTDFDGHRLTVDPLANWS